MLRNELSLGFSRDVIALNAEGLEESIVRGCAGGGSKTLYFHGHFDVVPAQSPNQFNPSGARARPSAAARPT